MLLFSLLLFFYDVFIVYYCMLYYIIRYLIFYPMLVNKAARLLAAATNITYTTGSKQSLYLLAFFRRHL